jgi:DNA-binding NarL/FixJ family response regulator
LAIFTGVFIMNLCQFIGVGSTASVEVRSGTSSKDVAKPAYAISSNVECVAISIVSNSRLFSEGLLTLLSIHIPIRSVANYWASSPIDSHLPNPADHVVLLDGNMDREVAQAWARYWRMCTPPAHIIALDMANDVDLIVDCIEAGVGGYTLQGESIDEIVQAIREVQQGLTKCSREVAGRLCARLTTARQIISDLALNVAPLTPRELEVLGYIAQNCSNHEIAALLVIEVRTVKHHVHNILEKLQLTNRRDAALHAAKQGWFRISNPP